ncbi:MAG TPA: type II CRISPR RNA-guided endonuclease Cas9 [Pirellulales bacterium]|nr:type II CRISPR RNA-guided endonuclease Cas9 [Pirellulales bacterium]
MELERLNPYELRRRALGERLEPFEIGRVLLHLNQRRGFLSNRKADRQKKAEDSKLLAEISELAKDIADAGHATLGEHLAALQDSAPLERVRGKHTRRSMLEEEFEKIWESQRRFHPQLLSEELKHGRRGRQSYPRKPERIGKGGAAAVAEVGLHGLIFFQRPMYWPKSVVGQCEFDPKQKRCRRADRAAQRFRLLQEVNNLRILHTDGEICELSDSQRGALLALLASHEKVEFSKIRTTLGLLDSDAFNLEQGDRGKLLGMKTDAILANAKFYGKKWHALPEDRKTAIVRSLLEDDEPEFKRRAVEEFKIDAAVAERMLEAPLPEGYASLGRETIERLLPFLEKRLPLVARDGSPSAARLAGFLAPWERPLPKGNFLPKPPEITNPLVRQALFEVRKLLNAIVREYGKPDAIHVELTREVKGSAAQRSERTKRMRENERQRDRIAAILEEHGEKPTRSKIEIYRLWEEQRQVCVYSGREISIRQLLGGEVNVDHILPYSRSLDDSLLNLVVCFRDENDAKGNQTPHEWLAATAPEKYEQLLLRASKLLYAKRVRFSQRSCELQEFINRQLSDTAYITNVVLDYLRSLDVDLLGTKGQLTSELRHEWGLNTVLRHDDVNRKNRDDHRHHAVDAVVVALTDRSQLQQLAKRRGADALPAPWPTFRADIEAAVNAINVSHRVRRKVAGALHNETVYGPTETEGVFVHRKPLGELTVAMVPLIRDDVIRMIVVDRLRKFGIVLDGAKREKKTIPKDAWREPLRMPSGTVIKKVRLLEKDKTITPLRGAAQFVKPNANHHLCIFAVTDEKGREKRTAKWVNMMEAARLVRAAEPLIQRTHPDHPSARFLMSISQGEMLLAEFGGAQKLVRFKTGASTSGQLWFLEHTDASRDSKPYSAMVGTLKARKVTVDLLGRIRWAND